MRNLRVLFPALLGCVLLACGGSASDGDPVDTVESALGDEVCNCPAVIRLVCGSDGKTYNNECEAECAGVKVVHTGKCNCYCPAVEDPVCGVDGVTYMNACVAACHEVEIAHDGPCGPVIGPGNP